MPLGVTSPAGGQAAADSVLRPPVTPLAGEVDAIVTAPLNKESLAARRPSAGPATPRCSRDVAGVSDVAMLFVGGGAARRRS